MFCAVNIYYSHVLFVISKHNEVFVAQATSLLCQPKKETGETQHACDVTLCLIHCRIIPAEVC